MLKKEKKKEPKNHINTKLRRIEDKLEEKTNPNPNFMKLIPHNISWQPNNTISFRQQASLRLLSGQSPL